MQPDEVLKDPVLEARARDISAGLRCLVCQNQSIDDSDAPLARDLRVIVRERLTAGTTTRRCSPTSSALRRIRAAAAGLRPAHPAPLVHPRGGGGPRAVRLWRLSRRRTPSPSGLTAEEQGADRGADPARLTGPSATSDAFAFAPLGREIRRCAGAAGRRSLRFLQPDPASVPVPCRSPRFAASYLLPRLLPG